jgi:hypothetical protein
MSLILKQESSANVPTPPAGKGTLFLNASDQVVVKDSAGNTSVFPTITTSNTQIVFNANGVLTGDSNLTFNNSTDTLTVSNLTVTGTLVAGDIAVSSIANGTSNVDIVGVSGNVTVSVAGNANIMTVTGTGVNVAGTLNATGVITGNGSGLSSLAYANIDQFTTAGLTVDELYLQSITRLSTTANGMAYVFDQYGSSNNNPVLYVASGQTLAFNLSVAGHPFLIQTSGNANYSTGLTHVSTTGTVTTGASAQGQTTGTLYWKVPYGITGNYKYQCQFHGAMNGNIVISDANVSNISVSSATTAGTVTTAAQPNITSVGTLTGLYVGATSSNVDFPNAVQVSSQDNSGVTANDNIGLIGEAVANSANANVTGIGVLGVARAVGGTKGTGVQGEGHVTNTADTGAAVGIRGYATDTHSGGYNIGILGNAMGSGIGNYAFYIQNGAIASIENATFWDLTDNSNAALTFNSTGKANIFGIETTDNAEGIFTSGYLNVVGNITAAGIKTNNYYYANGSPVDFQQAAGSNTQIQYNSSNDFGASANFTFNSSTNLLTVTGNISTGNVSASGAVTGATLTGTLTTAAQPNITSVGTLSSAAVTGNVTAGNVYANSGTIGASLLTGTLTTAAQPNITSVGTLTSATVTGNVVAGNVYANSGTIGANVITGTTVGGTLTTAAQPNITSVGTLTSVAVSGNANVGNLNATAAVVASTLTSNVATGTAPITVTSTTRVANLNVNYANVSDFGVVTAQSTGTYYPTFVNGSSTANYALAANSGFSANIANGGLTATTFVGNLSGNVLGTLANGTSSLSIPASGGNVNISAAGNANVFTVTGTGVNVAGTLNATGNANVGNLGATGVVATTLGGTLTTAAQPNITSVGTLSSLSVTANVAAGNLTTTGVLSVTGTGTSSIAGNLDMTGNTISNLATPAASTDAATKQYVDDVAQGLNVHDSCQAATPNTLASITGGTITYNNGTSGVGATLTTTGSYTTIDGVNVASVGTRILVKNEANAVHNGIYTYSSSTVLTRATDYDSVPEVEAGDFVFVTGGTLYDNTGWVQTSTVTAIGTAGNTIDFTQFSGAGTYTAGTGLTLTGSAFSVNASQTQVTALGTVTSGTWNSLVGSSATFAAGLSGANLASITGGNVSGQVGNALVAGTVYTAAQPNITSVGTLTSLAVTGTTTSGNFATAGNITASFLVSNVATGTAPLTVTSTTLVPNLYVARANVSDYDTVTLVSTGTYYPQFVSATSGNLASSANAVYVANIANGSFAATTFVGALSGAATTAGTVTTASQPNITSVGTLSSLAVTANVTAGNVYANSGTIGASLLTGTLTTAAQPNVTSLGTLTSLAVTGNVTSGNVYANSGTIGASLLTGTLTTAAQPNITSTGTLTSLTVSGNITAQANITVTNNVIHSVATGISAAGSTQGTATAITKDINVVSTVSSGQGVILPTAVAGMRLNIMNTSANALSVYPATNGVINSLSANAAFSLAAGGRLDFIATTTTQWYTLNATYA